ncbi:MAG: tetratricopeptide repeat protein [Nostoc sp.]|uniref:tetratricopeptide repeat protein n=1 Tax=Nostoc sp. TaxID=1180 RepID=UPI002FF8D32F
MRERLQQPGVVAISAISGMSGVGKTELATQYARQHQADYPGGICWLNARESDFAAEILQFALFKMNLEVPQELGERKLNLEQQVEWLWQNWQPTEGLVLIVLDDVTSLESCHKLLPKLNRFQILMTTRLRRIETNYVEISLDVLSAEDALIFLTKVLGEKDQRVKQESQVAENLCKWLGYLPLGLELVGRYLVKKPPHWNLAKMLERLKQQRFQDEAINSHKQQLQKTGSTAQLGVLDAFELSWDELDPITQRVGELLSLFALDIFAWEWVESATGRLNWDASEVETAVEQLYQRHLIQGVKDKSRDRDDCYKIHPLIREFLKVKRAASEQVDELKRAFTETFITIAKTIPELPIRRDIESVKDAIPHLTEVAQNLIDAVTDENLIWVFTGLHRFYSGQGLYTLAQPWGEQCVPVVRRSLEKTHPNYATSLNNLANIYYFQKCYQDAEPLYKEALDIRKSVLGEKHPYYAISMNYLGNIYTCQKRYPEAEELYQKVVELTRKIQGEKHPHLATYLNNLAKVYFFQKRYQDAEPLYEEAVQLTRKIQGEKHPDLATSLNNLGNLYTAQKRYQDAELLYEEAMQLTKEIQGEKHPNLAIYLENLAHLYTSQQLHEKAKPLYEKVLAIRQHNSAATQY